MPSKATRQRIGDWLEEDPAERMNESGLRKSCHIAYARFVEILRDEKIKRANKIAKVKKPIAGDVFDNDEFRAFSLMKQTALKRIWDIFMIDGKSQDFFRICQMMGWIIEKKEIEVKVGLTADEIARREKEALKELAEWERGRTVQGMDKVQAKPPLLSNAVRQD